MNNKVELTPAFLIHRRAYQESSMLLDFFTHDYGMLRLVARGAKKSKTKIQMFSRLNISFSGRSELKTLTNWEIDDKPRKISGDNIIFAIYVNELLTRLCHPLQAYPKLFDSYYLLLKNLASSDTNKIWALRIFENSLLKILGYGLNYKTDIDDNKIKDNLCYDYIAQRGFIENQQGKISGRLLGLLKENNMSNYPNNTELKNIRNLFRRILQTLLGDKPLKSRELFLDLKK